MWRPAHGATSRPGPSRPASGYGRALGRPGPRDDEPFVSEPIPRPLEPAWFVDQPEKPAEADAEAPAPVTP